MNQRRDLRSLIVMVCLWASVEIGGNVQASPGNWSQSIQRVFPSQPQSGPAPQELRVPQPGIPQRPRAQPPQRPERHRPNRPELPPGATGGRFEEGKGVRSRFFR